MSFSRANGAAYAAWSNMSGNSQNQTKEEALEMTEEEDFPLTFSDEGFDRRYSANDAAARARPTRPDAPATKPPAAPIGRSRNRFMRTLLRRRLAASVRS